MYQSATDRRIANSPALDTSLDRSLLPIHSARCSLADRIALLSTRHYLLPLHRRRRCRTLVAVAAAMAVAAATAVAATVAAVAAMAVAATVAAV